MQIHRAAKRYAQMLYELASESGESDRMFEVMSSISPLLSSSPELSAFLKNYSISPALRFEMLSSLFEKRCGDLFWKFLRFIEVKRRTGLLGHMAISYAQIYMKHHGIADALVRTPFVLDEAQQSSVRSHLEKKTSGKVILRAAEDDSLIGGFTILMDWKLYDSSVSGMLESLRRHSLNT